MNWFRENRFHGIFLAVFGLAALVALYLIFSTKSSWDEAAARFNENASELNRLEQLAPFPSGDNLRKMKVHATDYAAALERVKAELKTHVLPAPPLAPNEFQGKLRQATIAIAERARARKVKLPENFNLGFDEYATGLPNTAVAPALGQQLAAVELLVDLLIDARVDAITSLRRAPLPEERSAAPTSTPLPAAGRKPALAPLVAAKPVERSVIDLGFSAGPAAARKVLDQIASVSQQFFVLRTLHILNDKDKPPSRDAAPEAAPVAAPAPAAAAGAKPAASPGLNFIVGNEHLRVSASVEILRFNF